VRLQEAARRRTKQVNTHTHNESVTERSATTTTRQTLVTTLRERPTSRTHNRGTPAHTHAREVVIGAFKSSSSVRRLKKPSEEKKKKKKKKKKKGKHMIN